MDADPTVPLNVHAVRITAEQGEVPSNHFATNKVKGRILFLIKKNQYSGLSSL